jgi:hypothetical protein
MGTWRREGEVPSPGGLCHARQGLGADVMRELFQHVAVPCAMRSTKGRVAGRTAADCVLAESFNASLKVKRVHRTVYPTREKARQDVARYIELRYNRTRLHSALGYRTPQEVHDEYLNWQRAA